MRIALDARALAHAESGIGGYTVNLVRALLAADPDLELVLICRTTPAQAGLQDPRITVVRFPFHPMSPATQYALPAWLRPHRFDLFHAPFEVVPCGLRQPLVVTVHDLNWFVNPRYNSTNPFRRLVEGTYYRASLRTAMQQARRLLAVSHATRHAIHAYAPWHAGKTCVTYHGIDAQRIAPLAPDLAWGRLRHLLPPGTPFVLTVGQGTPYKNHANAVRGFLAAFGGHPHYRLVLVRRFVRRDPALDTLLRTPHVRAQVLLLPYVPPDVLNALYHAARMVLHPSYYEGFGLPLLEAMQAGTPLVTSCVSAMPEIAGPAALLVDPADPEAIAAALVRLDHDAAVRARCIAAGRQRLACFSWSRCARTTLAVYREVAGSWSQGRSQTAV
jgi:glycosyltransferase involved in cell wall biosynthesis